MTAATGDALYPSTSLYPGAGTTPGQGPWPLLLALYSTDDVSVPVPVWGTVVPRSFSLNRGRESELDEIDAGSCTITLDDRDRRFDPSNNALIRPLNRWWLRAQFSGATSDLFKGYAESYDTQWPDRFRDAISVVSCADEMKVLALQDLPTTNPPRDTYTDLVASDSPDGYWPMDDDGVAKIETGSPGPNLVLPEGLAMSNVASGAIVGQDPVGCLRLPAGNILNTFGIAPGDAGEVNNLTEFSLEFWWQCEAALGDGNLVTGPDTGGDVTYQVKLNSGGTIVATCKDGTGTTRTLHGPGVFPDLWYHVAVTQTPATFALYLNGQVADSDVGLGTMANDLDPFAELYVGGTASASSMLWDEMAYWRRGLSAPTVLNHYVAGVNRGFTRGQLPSARIHAVLDAVASTAPRAVQTGTRAMTGAYMRGQPPLDELRNARLAENVDAMLFVSSGGAVTFLDASHRTVSPWNTVQAVFGDSGGTSELPYTNLGVDYSEAFLANEWNVTASGGSVQTRSDTASIAAYFKRSQSLTDLPVTDDSVAGTVAAAMLAKYKDPMFRVTTLEPNLGNPDACAAALARELGDRITVKRTPPGGGSRISQTLFVQKIQVSGDASSPLWNVSWNVSPL